MGLPDLNEYRKMRGADDGGKAENVLRRLGTLHRAAVQTELLTGNPHWDEFLGYIQAAVEEAERQRDGFMEALDDPNIVDDAQVRKLRNARLACNERIGAWRAVMELPKDLLENKSEIKALMDRMENV